MSKGEQNILKGAFESGAEKDFYMRATSVGHTAAGKTTMMRQFLYIKFKPEEIKSTYCMEKSPFGSCCVDMQSGKLKAMVGLNEY